MSDSDEGFVVTERGMVVGTGKSGDLTPFGTPDTIKATAAWLMRFESPATRRAYTRSRRKFESFVRDICHLSHPAEVKRAHVDAFARWMETEGLAPATRHLRLAAVSSWFDALLDEGWVQSNPCVGVRRPKRESTGQTPCPKTGDVRLILSTLDELRPGGVALAVGLMTWYGLRVGSVAGLRVGDVMVDSSGTVWLRCPVKGGRRVPVRLGAGELGERVRVLSVGRADEDPLFVTETGGTVTVNVIAGAMRQVSKKLGLPGIVTPHQLRTWAINAALESGMPVNDVAEFAMHSDVRTTMRYDRNRRRRVDAVAVAVAAALEGGAS